VLSPIELCVCNLCVCNLNKASAITILNSLHLQSGNKPLRLQSLTLSVFAKWKQTSSLLYRYTYPLFSFFCSVKKPLNSKNNHMHTSFLMLTHRIDFFHILSHSVREAKTSSLPRSTKPVSSHRSCHHTETNSSVFQL